MWATALSGYLFVALSLVAGVNWWFNHKIKESLAELKPNGGSSMNDRLSRVESRVDDIYRILLERQ